jgi:hypothetical protein
MRKILCALFLAIVSTLGCTTPDGSQQPPPSPLEAKLAAQTIMLVALSAEKVDAQQTDDLITVFVLTKQSLMTALSEDPSGIQGASAVIVKGVDPLYQDLVDGVVQILLIRIRPYVDQQNPDLQLAMEYVEAVMDGATTALNKHKTRLELGGLA